MTARCRPPNVKHRKGTPLGRWAGEPVSSCTVSVGSLAVNDTTLEIRRGWAEGRAGDVVRLLAGARVIRTV